MSTAKVVTVVHPSATVNNIVNDASGNVAVGNNLTVAGYGAFSIPVTVNAGTYTVAATDSSLIFTTTNNTLTLPAAASYSGRFLHIKNITANSVTSASSNVVPIGSATAGTAVLAATAGKFATLQSDGTNWVTMAAN